MQALQPVLQEREEDGRGRQELYQIPSNDVLAEYIIQSNNFSSGQIHGKFVAHVELRQDLGSPGSANTMYVLKRKLEGLIVWNLHPCSYIEAPGTHPVKLHTTQEAKR